MLDAPTKRRIDTARDILVGKVPDPKSQVEQITIALIYKFMDDMDAQAEELGGKRKFFAAGFARYGWAKLMAPGTSGHELIGLYGEGIAKMPENPGIPKLFREIFKNAFLPYRDPETLKAFLKTINEFEYDHSERLGDAFEYLLSVLGSQGDAGQFRTPRHIIDFIVAVVDPKKTETVLDPACGTAGFLISAYKHIRRANTSPSPSKGEGRGEGSSPSPSKGEGRGEGSSPSASKGEGRGEGSSPSPSKGEGRGEGSSRSPSKGEGRGEGSSPSPSKGEGRGEGGGLNGESALHVSRIPPAKGDLLTPDERKKLADNFRGYDISPDMVRLSLVNMYLHGFTDPHVFEYDTLTSQDRWNEMADCILANPPFMSPKGGIKPHNRFSVPSKRSEVLFVDYMAEHLTPGGRAGIIVPEGIIFQSQTAYKALRKMLVEQYLVAVVSLPAGVFNPYSGVKTSILILDKSLAKQSDTVGFFKVENDGFSLGAQRRPIDKNDLPQVLAEINEYLRRLRARESVFTPSPGIPGEGRREGSFTPARGLIVAKEKIAANGDFNLSGERYRVDAARLSQYPHVQLGEVVEILDSLRRPITKSDRKPGPYPYYGATGVLDHVEGYLFDELLVLVGEDGAKWGPGENSAFPVDGKVWVNNHAHVLRPKRDLILDRYLIELLNLMDLMPFITGVTVPKLNQEKLRSIEIPLPPLEVQKEIVAEIEAYQKVIDGARAVLDHYRPHIPINPEWPMVEIGDVVESAGVGLVKNKGEQDPAHPYPYVRMNSITKGGTLDLRDLVHVDATPDEVKLFALQDGDYLYNTRNSPELVGKSAVFHGESGRYLFNNNILRMRLNHRAMSDFVNTIMSGPYGQAKIQAQVDGTTSVAALYQRNYFAIEIPLPPLAEQEKIVAEIEAEQRLVEANRQLIERMEQKIAATLARIWGDNTRSAHDGSTVVEVCGVSSG